MLGLDPCAGAAVAGMRAMLGLDPCAGAAVAGMRAMLGPDPCAGAASPALTIFELCLGDPGDDHHWDVPTDQLDDCRDGSAVFGYRQHQRPAEPAGASGAADAVDVILGVDWHGEAEDVAQAFDVQAAGRDI